jgi:CheY-like chemotaxis protein
MLPAVARRCVLVAEDDASLLRLLVRLLETDGHEVLAAGDAEQALALVARHGAQLRAAVLDAGLRPRGAREVVEALGPAAGGAGLVLVSGGGLDGELEALVHGRGGIFLRKPFAARALRDALARAGCAAGGAA